MEREKGITHLGLVTFFTGQLAGKSYPLDKPVITIGRGVDNDLVIHDDPRVSRHHARLLWEQGAWTIENLSQKNSLSINQRQIMRARVQDQDIVVLGGTSFRLIVQPEVKETSAPAFTPSPYQMPSQPTPSAASPQVISTSAPTFPSAPSQPPLMPPQPPAPAARISPEAVTVGVPQSYPDLPSPDLTSVMARPSQTIVASAVTLGGPVLEVSISSMGTRQRYALDKSSISIGRDVTNDIVINDAGVSKHHLQIVREGSRLVLLHPAPDRPITANGLLYQGRKIRGDEAYRKVLAHNDMFRIGSEDGSVVTLIYQESGATEQEATQPVRPIQLGAQELTIGRKPENTVVLAHPQVSGHHARLVREGGTYRILDMNSTNHVYVNAQLVTDQILKFGDEIRIGPYRLVYESTQLIQYDESNNIRIDALSLRTFGTRGVTLLNNISLSIAPRSFVALVGASGAGKTTLLDALSGLRPAQEGRILYNGQNYYENLAAFNTQIGYVPQDDIVHRDLRVERALYYAAKLRLPKDFTEEQIWQRIAEVLEEVELTERRKLLIKKLSGGQRKRVSLALELLANPSVLFLDEPTSGLDPGLDRKMMLLLRKLADRGHTIILVTHATNNVNVCDYVCFLAVGGRLAYFGPPEKAKDYFGKSDIAEIYSNLEATEEHPNSPEEVEARFKLSDEYQVYLAEPLKKAASDGKTLTSGAVAAPGQAKVRKRVKRGSPVKQFLLLSRRNVELLKNDRGNLFFLLMQAPLIALFLMLLVRFEIGPGLFNANNVVACQPQISTASGPLGVPSKSQTVPCDQIVTFLHNDPQGSAFAQARGGVNQALQDFILPGQGLNAQRALFLSAFVAVLFGVLNSVREIVKEAAIY
ncbi:MAG TPA: FHA domain-containing protein, partial [Ktedonobacterales bacterium]